MLLTEHCVLAEECQIWASRNLTSPMKIVWSIILPFEKRTETMIKPLIFSYFPDLIVLIY